jgi:murein DD-endopeptidase MepM/ murein hydrolase activator NlpD
MSVKQRSHIVKILLLVFIGMLAAMLACVRAVGPAQAPWSISDGSTKTPFQAASLNQDGTPGTRPPNAPILSPTPDDPKLLPTMRIEEEQYIVQAGDTMGKIAGRNGISLEALIAANDIPNPDILEIGTQLTIPAPQPGDIGPIFKIIPDSELVYGPGSIDFDVDELIRRRSGYLENYTEEVDGTTTSGSDILQRIAREFSINPRLLLAVLEYSSNWVTADNPLEETRDYPMGVVTYNQGLYYQLAWAAKALNYGFYQWRVGGTGSWVIEGQIVPVNPRINAGTAGVQYMFSQVLDRSAWNTAVSDQGLYATYLEMFGYPFDRAVEPVVPQDLLQPKMQLPFEEGQVWSFTGGPHSGWADGSAWAALDFAPPGEALGCVQTDAWVTAIASGPVIRAGNGEVIQDIDSPGSPSDGYEQTGWTVLYMHIETRDRVAAGTYLNAGDKIGHPSCEGGYSTGTHLHLARRYNGEWIPADQTLPFMLDGWISRGAGREYDGYLIKDSYTIEAWEGRSSNNAIQR